MAVIRTYKNLQDELLALLDEAGDTSTTLTLVKNALNAAHVKRLTEEAWSFMLWDAVTFPTVVGQRAYALHPEYFRPLYFKNLTLNALINQFDEGNVVTAGRDWNNETGSATDFTLWARQAVKQQPSSASVLTISSSNVLDNAVRSVIVRGDTADGVRNETIICNTTGTVQFTKILRVTKKDVWVGTLTVTSNAGAVTNLVLFPEEAGRSHQQLEFLITPDVAESVEYRFYRQPSPLVEDEDTTDIPPPFEMLLVYDAFLIMAAYNQADPQTIVLVQQKRDDLLTGMRQSNDSQANALEAIANYTTYIER